jgi:TonB family protein
MNRKRIALVGGLPFLLAVFSGCLVGTGSADPGGAHATAVFDTEPVPLREIHADYACDLFDRRITGVVVLGYDVGIDGSVSNVGLIESEFPELVQPAIEAVRRVTFRPALRNGIPVVATLRQTIIFEPRENGIVGIRGL